VPGGHIDTVSVVAGLRGEYLGAEFEELPQGYRGLLPLHWIVESDKSGLRTDGPMTNREGSIIMTFHGSGGGIPVEAE
jgi:hypothetical protein